MPRVVQRIASVALVLSNFQLVLVLFRTQFKPAIFGKSATKAVFIAT